MCQSYGLFEISLKRSQQAERVEIEAESEEILSCEAMLIQLDEESPNDLLDNVLFHIAGFLVRPLLQKLTCNTCKSALLLDPTDPNATKYPQYPLYAKFTLLKQKSGLIFPYPAVLKIVKATEVLFKRRVLWMKKAINFQNNISLQIEGALLKQLGPTIFSNVLGQFFDHTLIEESDHLTTLMRVITKKYLSMRLKTYAKKYTKVVAIVISLQVDMN